MLRAPHTCLTWRSAERQRSSSPACGGSTAKPGWGRVSLAALVTCPQRLANVVRDPLPPLAGEDQRHAVRSLRPPARPHQLECTMRAPDDSAASWWRRQGGLSCRSPQRRPDRGRWGPQDGGEREKVLHKKGEAGPRRKGPASRTLMGNLGISRQRAFGRPERQWSCRISRPTPAWCA